MSLVRRGLRAAQRLLPAAADGAVILCYHLVGGGTASAVDLPLDVFRRQMEELAGDAVVVGLEDAVEMARRGDAGRRVVLTFDDAYANFADVAWPVLDSLALPATLFVPVGFLDRTHGPPNTAADLPPMSWNALRDLASSERLTVGSHSLSHPDLRALSPDAARRELRGSRDLLEERTGRPVRSFCYPRALWSPRVEPRVGEVYEFAAVGGGRRLRPGRVEPLRLQRVSLRRDMPVELGPILRARVWLEEWIADAVRRRR